MGTMVQTPDASDPLLEFPSLLPRTITIDNLNRIKDLQKSAFDALARTSVDFTEQANSVLKSSSERRHTSSPHGYKDRDMPPRRPDLGLKRKRPRFSLNPTPSQPTVGGGMSLDIAKLGDPAEFYKACDVIKKAEKELKRLAGDVSTDLTQPKSSKIRRERRPGLPGYERKSDYQQLFASKFQFNSISVIDEKLDPSQELLSEVGSPIQSNGTFKSTSTHKNGASQELAGNEFIDPAAEEKNKMESLLDQLLSQDSTDLDGDGAVKFLQKNLELGPINLDRLHLLEVKSLRKAEGKVSLKALSDIKNVAKRIIGRGSVEKQQVAVGSTYSPDFPTPPRSSSSSVPMSSRYVLEADRRGNPFSFPGIDDIFPVEDSIHVKDSDKDGGPVHVDSTYDTADVNGTEPSFPEKFVSKAKEKHSSTSSMVSHKMVTEDSTQMVDHMEDSSSKSSDRTNLNLYERDAGFADKVNYVQQFEVVDKESISTHSNMDLDKLVTDLANSLDPLDDYSEHTNLAAHGYEGGLEDKVEDPQTVSSDGVELRYKGPTLENPRTFASQVDISCPMDEDHPEDGNPENAVTLSGVHNKVPQERSKESLNLRSKQKAASIGSDSTKEVSKSKNVAGDSLNVRRTHKPTLYTREREISRRKSLTGAGTLWQQGVRRSTRRKMKPLEYWRGERLLYARVHDSLVTVVGCKCISPGNSNESPKLKVRSFVSDDYKDIVDKVADMQGKRVLSLKCR